MITDKETYKAMQKETKDAIEKAYEKIKKENLKYCRNCYCMTKTKKGYVYLCGKCGKDRRGK